VVRRKKAPQEEDEDSSPYTVRAEPEPPPAPRTRRPLGAGDDDRVTQSEEYRRERALAQRRRKKRSREFSGSLIPGLSNFAALLAGLGLLWLVLGGLTFAFPLMGIAAILVGLAVSACGGIWFHVVAFQESVAAGLMCLFVPFYALFFLFTNLDRAGRPFLVNMVGSVILLTGGVVMAFRLDKESLRNSVPSRQAPTPITHPVEWQPNRLDLGGRARLR
jgi:hypothetical protein